MSGLELLALIPIGLALAQLIQPFFHGLRRLKDKANGREVRLNRQTLTHQARKPLPPLPNSDRGDAQRGREATTQSVVQEMQYTNRELMKFAGNAQRGWEASTRGFVEEMHYSHREALQFAENTQVRWEASTRAFVQETQNSRQQIIWFACVTTCLAYALGQAQGENRYLRQMRGFLDERGMELQNLEGRSWLIALAMWPLRSTWAILAAFVRWIKTVLGTLGEMIWTVLTTVGRVVRMSFGGITGAVYWLCKALSRPLLWIFGLPFNMTKLFRRSSGITAPAQANVTAPTSPSNGSSDFGSLSTLPASVQTSIPAEALAPRDVPSPAAVWLASTIHRLFSTVIFLVNYPANFVCDFLIAFFEIMGIHRLFVLVPLGLAATALLGLFILHFWKLILGGQRCHNKSSPGEETIIVFVYTLCWAVVWRFLEVLGTPEPVIGLLGAAVIILPLIEGRVQKCSYVICVHSL